MMLVGLGKLKSNFKSPYSVQTCVSRLKNVTYNKRGILSNKLSVDYTNEDTCHFSIEMMAFFRKVARLEGMLIYQDEKATQVEFVSFLSAFQILIIVISYMFILVIGLSYWFGERHQFLPLIGFALLWIFVVSLYWMMFPKMLADLVKDILS